MIHATCHTADNVLSFEFDATPWFSEADAPSIVDLAQRGWSSTAIAESLEGRRGYERLHELVEYAAERLQPESLEDPTWETFESIVDGPEALAWLEKNRPDVAARNPEDRSRLVVRGQGLQECLFALAFRKLLPANGKFSARITDKFPDVAWRKSDEPNGLARRDRQSVTVRREDNGVD